MTYKVLAGKHRLNCSEGDMKVCQVMRHPSAYRCLRWHACEGEFLPPSLRGSEGWVPGKTPLLACHAHFRFVTLSGPWFLRAYRW
jgi:hypothetical protein